TSLARALICDTTFSEAFDGIWGVATSLNGNVWAVGTRRGEVRIWNEGGQTLYLVWQAHIDIVPTLAFSPDGHWPLEVGMGRSSSGTWTMALCSGWVSIQISSVSPLAPMA